MKQGNVKNIAKVLLFIILFSMMIPFVGTTSKALSMDDLGIDYSNQGIVAQSNSAWEKNTDQANAWNTIFTKYKGVIMGVSGVATLTMVVLFIMNFMKLGSTANNPQERTRVLTGLLWTGLAAAGAGGVTIFVGVASNLLKD